MAKGIALKPGCEGEPRTFPGIPSPVGGYGPGVVHPLSVAGMTEDEAAEAIEGTDLEIVALPASKAKKEAAEAAETPAEGGES